MALAPLVASLRTSELHSDFCAMLVSRPLALLAEGKDACELWRLAPLSCPHGTPRLLCVLSKRLGARLLARGLAALRERAHAMCQCPVVRPAGSVGSHCLDVKSWPTRRAHEATRRARTRGVC